MHSLRMDAQINQHIRDYLDRYLSKEARYAVMVSGDWGSGKTFLVREHLKERTSALIVSANGIASTADLTERLYLSAYPVLGDKTMRALGSIAKTIAGAFRIKSELKMDDLLQLDRFSTLVIDDLERTKIPIDELFGFLNEFIEHDDKHLIVIGYEDEINEPEKYRRIKEKVVGFTAIVQPEYETVLTKITGKGGSYNQFLDSEREVIIAALKDGSLQNLRILENAIEDSEPVYMQAANAGLSKDQLINLYLPFLLLTYYFRKGEIGRKDIEARQVDSLTRAFREARDGYEPDGLEKLAGAHPQIDLHTSDFDNEFLIAKICDGREASDLLERTLGDIKGRSDPTSNPEWRNLWYFLQQTDEVIVSSFNRMMKKFADRDYIDLGEILHVIGLMYQMREIGLLSDSRKEIEDKCRQYIDEQATKGVLAPLEDDYLGGFRHGAAHGLGFTKSDEPGFKRLYAYLNLRSLEGRDRKLKSELDNLMESHPFDLQKFRSIILQGERNDNVYARQFLGNIDPKKLASAILAETAEMQFEILYALRARYHQSPFPDVRTAEAPWLRRLIYALRHSKLSNISRHRINRTLNMTIVTASKVAS